MFYTITNLQGSQTLHQRRWHDFRFYTITNLQGSQTYGYAGKLIHCFTPLQTYKVLKQRMNLLKEDGVLHHYKLTRFSNELVKLNRILLVLHHYKLTRFSNGHLPSGYRTSVLHHYKLTRFSNQCV